MSTDPITAFLRNNHCLQPWMEDNGISGESLLEHLGEYRLTSVFAFEKRRHGYASVVVASHGDVVRISDATARCLRAPRNRSLHRSLLRFLGRRSLEDTAMDIIADIEALVPSGVLCIVPTTGKPPLWFRLTRWWSNQPAGEAQYDYR